VFAGPRGGGPRLLIVSDLPLQGGVRISAPQMAQAIAFVVRRHGFRAGRYEVAYQSCDDSVGRTGLADDAKCASNARAYGRNAEVVGVIGTLNSGCAVGAIPLLNRAQGGPLAMISPSNSYVGLTRAGPGTPAGGLNELYPTGRRNYLRVFPTDDLQGAALARLLADEGARRVFVLDDGQPGYGKLQSLAFARAARRAGLRVVGTAQWDPQATSYGGLAARVAATRPQAVFLGGLIDSNGPIVVRDLRRRLGREPLLVAPDGFTPISVLLARGGPGAHGTYVSIAGLTNASFGTAARRFEHAFGATQPGVPVEPSAVYAAQAAEVLLDAIARSDGTRASVLRALFSTRLRDSLIGDVSFDRNGDVEQSPITIVRAERPGGSSRIQSIDGATVVRVVRPSLDLVR
jgi:branched-chain amino acid transport system substrate-binding protein